MSLREKSPAPGLGLGEDEIQELAVIRARNLVGPGRDPMTRHREWQLRQRLAPEQLPIVEALINKIQGEGPAPDADEGPAPLPENILSAPVAAVFAQRIAELAEEKGRALGETASLRAQLADATQELYKLRSPPVFVVKTEIDGEGIGKGLAALAPPPEVNGIGLAPPRRVSGPALPFVRSRGVDPSIHLLNVATPGAAGRDLVAVIAPGQQIDIADHFGVYADAEGSFDLLPNQRVRISTGVSVEIPPGHVGLVLPRSSVSWSGIFSFTGVIDSDYRGEIGVHLWNISPAGIKVKNGDRVAQLVITPIATMAATLEVEALSKTARGSNGWGSTGK